MTTTLREVITRFRLDTSEEDVRNFNNKLASMKGGLRGLASAFGITLGVGGVVAISKMGLSAERARFQIERLAGADIGRIDEIFARVNQQLETLRAGASGIFRRKDFDQAAAEYVRVFGTGAKELDAFGRLWEFAAKQSALTGKSTTEIAGALQTAIESGGFDALLDIPGFTQYRKQLLEFQQQAMDPGEPGGQIAIQNRMRAILRIVQESSEGQAKALRKVPGELLTADRAANKMQEALERVGDAVMKSLVPALESLVKLLNTIIGKTSEIEKNAARAGVNPFVYGIGEAYSQAGKAITNPGKLPSSPLPSLFGPELPGQDEVGPLEGAKNRLRFLGYGAPSGTKPEPKTEINIENNFTITSTDPMSAAREAAKKIKDSLSEARTVPPTERR